MNEQYETFWRAHMERQRALSTKAHQSVMQLGQINLHSIATHGIATSEVGKADAIRDAVGGVVDGPNQ